MYILEKIIEETGSQIAGAGNYFDGDLYELPSMKAIPRYQQEMNDASQPVWSDEQTIFSLKNTKWEKFANNRAQVSLTPDESGAVWRLKDAGQHTRWVIISADDAKKIRTLLEHSGAVVRFYNVRFNQYEAEFSS